MLFENFNVYMLVFYDENNFFEVCFLAHYLLLYFVTFGDLVALNKLAKDLVISLVAQERTYLQYVKLCFIFA